MEKRKNMYRVFQLSNLIVLGILTIVLLSANTVGVNEDGYDVLELIAAILFFSELILNLVFFSMAICNFKALLNQMPNGVKISRVQLYIHTALIILWTAFTVWVSVNVVKSGRYMLKQYYPIQQALVGDIFAQILSLMLAFLVNYVLFRSS